MAFVQVCRYQFVLKMQVYIGESLSRYMKEGNIIHIRNLYSRLILSHQLLPAFQNQVKYKTFDTKMSIISSIVNGLNPGVSVVCLVWSSG